MTEKYKKTQLSPEQDSAANPTQNVWVQANAGTGKTSVLTDRLLRILFRTRDITKSGILCLTYTNAGAGEMRNRILRNLKTWALASDDNLCELLDGIAINKNITDDDIAHAREIFFTYIDNPDMLKVKTIHGFCEEILHRFPIEANISPAWKLVSGADQGALLWDAFNNMITSSLNSDVDAAFSHIVNRVSEYSIDNLLGILAGHYKDFFGINNFVKYRKYFIENTRDFLGIKNAPNTNVDPCILQNIINWASENIDDKKPKKYLQDIIELTPKYMKSEIDFEEYKNVFLTKDGSKKNTLMNKDAILSAEQDRVYAINLYNENKRVFDDTIALFDLSAAFAHSYIDIKRAHNILDFEDLILYTRKLFSNRETMGWVLSQMDVSLSHILLDEAQDTSPQQWDIIRMLTGDFFDDGDTNDLPRSLFVVGDIKQSIYGFQGADPTAFIRSRADIASQIENNYRVIRDIPLSQNFRSLSSILYAVDTFFQDDIVKNISGFINQTHICMRRESPGAVELHKLVARGNDGSDMPEYIKKIAEKIKSIIDSGKYTAQDIMVLVQNRHPFAMPLVAELKKMSIPVAGSDRIILPNFPAIRDLLNLTRFCLDNRDDYSLCCVLKSPLYRFSENQIYDICKLKNDAKSRAMCSGKESEIPSVFDVLESYSPEVRADLLKIVKSSANMAPYSFFSFILRNNDTRQKMIAALGTQIIDPLEEFMTICLAYERTQSGTLHEFLKWFITGGAEVKRDMNATSGVRVVTVHGSKGLEAPVVFLIDTANTPNAENILTIPQKTKSDFPLPWIWRAPESTKIGPVQMAIDARQSQQIAEYYRLLYVAMTRARDELYIYGFISNKNPNATSWHTNLWRVFGHLYNASDNQEYIRIEHEYRNR